ncbi:MAG: TIGR02996 domain-containing protein [Gemmataceae bacterium]|nr:TIGR02996 domain-containing protein [Gemmataceae bacterium]
MDDGEALIRAIRANRDDDLPRLVYADWLEEQGDHARAEFVRLQCWLSGHPESDPLWEANWYREQELLQAHGPRWEAVLAGYSTGTVEFDRGFPSWFYTHDVREFGRVVGELARATATDRLKVCRTGDEDLDTYYRCEALSAVRELVPNADIQGLLLDGVDRLVDASCLQQLCRLDLENAIVGAGSPDAELLARQPLLLRLEHLHLGPSYPPDIDRIVELLTSFRAGRLRGLEVSYLREADIVELCRCPGLAHLTHLDIGWCITTDAGGRALAECPYLDRIGLLNFAGEGGMNGAGEFGSSLRPAVYDQLRERFGDRIVLDPMVYVVGPDRTAYRRRVLTGRRR